MGITTSSHEGSGDTGGIGFTLLSFSDLSKLTGVITLSGLTDCEKTLIDDQRNSRTKIHGK
jgi:hypothetical protein